MDQYIIACCLIRGIATSASARADALVSHLDDGTVTVQRCSGRFLVRENESNQAVEVGRCYTLHEALEAAHALSNGQSYQFSAVLSHDVQPSVLPADAQNSGENGKLRCMYCLDNTSILVCAFCGCKVRFCVLL